MTERGSFRRTLGRLAADETGATIVEFAIVAPVFLVLLLGIFDFGHGIYAQAVLQGAVNQAGRNSGLESGADQLAEIDESIRAQVRNIVPQGAILTSRRNYQSFNDVNKPEDFVDANGNGVYDAGECFTDVNGNGVWDADRSLEGLGGADDVVLYTASLEYDRIVPLYQFIGGDRRRTIAASTILRNQPFGSQATRPEVQICPN
jgi:Flp pilus assembly pilin Flp